MYKCGTWGHISKDCPEKKKGGGGGSGNANDGGGKRNNKKFQGECFRCGKKGHRRADCRVKLDGEAAQQAGTGGSSYEVVLQAVDSVPLDADRGKESYTIDDDFFDRFGSLSCSHESDDAPYADVIGIPSEGPPSVLEAFDCHCQVVDRTVTVNENEWIIPNDIEFVNGSVKKPLSDTKPESLTEWTSVSPSRGEYSEEETSQYEFDLSLLEASDNGEDSDLDSLPGLVPRVDDDSSTSSDDSSDGPPPLLGRRWWIDDSSSSSSEEEWEKESSEEESDEESTIGPPPLARHRVDDDSSVSTDDLLGSLPGLVPRQYCDSSDS